MKPQKAGSLAVFLLLLETWCIHLPRSWHTPLRLVGLRWCPLHPFDMPGVTIRRHLLLLVVCRGRGNDADWGLVLEKHTGSGKTIVREKLSMCVVELAPGAHFRRDILAA